MNSVTNIVTQTVHNISALLSQPDLNVDTLADILVTGVMSNHSIEIMTQHALSYLPHDQRTGQMASALQNFIQQSLLSISSRVGQEYQQINGGLLHPSLDRPLGENMMTYEQFHKIFPLLDEKKAKEYFPILMQGMLEGGMNTPLRQAAFLAEVAHETNGLRALSEKGGKSYWNQYEPNSRSGKNIGNTQIGDGYRFRGRGLLHLTGRYNYEICGKAIGIDLVNNPDLVSQDFGVSIKSAVWFWNKFHCSVPADRGDIDGVTRIINRYEVPQAMQWRRDRYSDAKSAMRLK